MKNKLRYIILLGVGLLISTFSCMAQGEQLRNALKPKYVFLFIGDGMGKSHVELTHSYIKSAKGKIRKGKLSFTGFHAYAECTTESKDSKVTDSGAAGSAIACGKKANNGSIAFYPEYPTAAMPASIAKKAHSIGYKVGIITNVSIDHATPAVFYAVNESRENYYDIGYQLPLSGFEFFGGGGFKYPKGKENDQEDLYDRVKEFGYVVTNDILEISQIDTSVNGLMFVNPVLLEKGEMPYGIDREEHGGNELKDIVREAIGFLFNDKGFFIMVEGGKIDWASHNNDAATIAQEVMDFNNAILEAFSFYSFHPNETLIIVTADHETGGIYFIEPNIDSINNKGYLNMQISSVDYFSDVLLEYKNSNTAYSLKDVISLANLHFYSQPLVFSEKENKDIDEAYNLFFYNNTTLSNDEIEVKYGGLNPVAVVFSNILSNRAGVAFSTWDHTDTMVPVYTLGLHSVYFNEDMDNTNFMSKLNEIMKW
ncbi:MAG TPA: alkaline phosphatase [Bacteroidales bacterium]|nr:alkaline phosphatase [Bacteroidales bacterium]